MADELEFGQDEDLARAKAFWKENGKSIIAGIVIGLVGIGGYQGWQFWQKSQGENASTLFANMQQADVSTETAADMADDLKANFSGTPYASHGALMMAKRAMESGDATAAKTELQWVLDKSKDEGLKHVARIRLAMVLLSEDKADGVLTLLNGVATSEFVGRYAELRGDALVLKGDVEGAREAYNESLNASSSGMVNSQLVQLKIDNLDS